MKWWKKALIGSAIWTVIIVIGALFMMQRIENEAASVAHRDAWATKLGQTTVYLFAFGLAVVWGLLWSRQGRFESSLKDNPRLAAYSTPIPIGRAIATAVFGILLASVVIYLRYKYARR